MFLFKMGQKQLDFIDYEDFCEQVAGAVGQDEVLGVINTCSGHPEKLADRVERFIKENGYGIKLKCVHFLIDPVVNYRSRTTLSCPF